MKKILKIAIVAMIAVVVMFPCFACDTSGYRVSESTWSKALNLSKYRYVEWVEGDDSVYTNTYVDGSVAKVVQEIRTSDTKYTTTTYLEPRTFMTTWAYNFNEDTQKWEKTIVDEQYEVLTLQATLEALSIQYDDFEYDKEKKQYVAYNFRILGLSGNSVCKSIKIKFRSNKLSNIDIEYDTHTNNIGFFGHTEFQVILPLVV